MKINIKLNLLLEERGITQREFARITGIRSASINEMCNNETKRIPLNNLAVICEKLKVNVQDVLELEKENG